MKDWAQRNPLLVALAAVALMLAVAIGLEAVFGSSVTSALDSAGRKRAVPAEAKLLPPLAAISPEQAYPETAARPLFLPTRRPAPEAPASAQGALQKGQYILQGVIIVGDNRIAMLREKSSGHIHRVEQGKEVNGIKVVAIERDNVTLASGSDEEKLPLTVQKPAGAPSAVQAGPFGVAPPGAVPPAPVQPPQPGAFNPAGPGAAPMPAPVGANPAARPVPEATAAGPTPLTPEEALARRRAVRRNPQQAN